MNNKQIKLVLVAILLLGGFLRFYGLDWDQGFHFHPDERAIVMTVEKLKYPQSIAEFFSPASPWNPNFFAYGSFPFYLLKVVGDAMSVFNPEFAQYGLLNIPGRILSGFFDLVTIIFIFKIGRRLFSAKVGLLTAFLYSVSVLPIQLSHFYAVDTLLTCFITMTLYQVLIFYNKPTTSNAVLIGLFFGLALATKISAVVLLAAIGMTLAIDFLIHFCKKPLQVAYWLPVFKQFLQTSFHYLALIFLITVITFTLMAPYAVIDFQNYWQQTQYQSLMTKDPFVFPYTLQYVGKIPYFYELSNAFLYGLGPFLGVITALGFIVFITRSTNLSAKKKAMHSILLTFIILYFAIIGHFSIGFMRYMLPLYPFFALFAACGIAAFFKYFELKGTAMYIVSGYLGFAALTWAFSFIHIYTQPNTRITAAVWAMRNIPTGSTIAVEHWDDLLPNIDPANYPIQTLALYDADTPEKWQKITAQLAKSNYIIIASNRLYTPLQKLTDCPNLPPGRCYAETARYYQQLFTGQLGFVKIAEFSSYPTVPLLNTKINDQSADESFTVYDHPKIMIFQKQRAVTLQLK